MITYKRIGIIGAMEVEVEMLQEAMQSEGGCSVTKHAGLNFYEGSIKGHSCVVVMCGIGMVNSAACTQALIDIFDVDAIINAGVAGSLDAQMDIGNVLIATSAVNHLFDLTNLGYDMGVVPGFDSPRFPCSKTLREALVSAADEVGLTSFVGRVASGDVFVCSDAEKERIVRTFGAGCCEMEGAAMAQVCANNGVDCAIVRAISDKADGSSSVDYPTFEKQAAADCAKLVECALAKL